MLLAAGFHTEKQDPLLSKQRTESAALGTFFSFLLVFCMVFRSLFKEGVVQVKVSPAIEASWLQNLSSHFPVQTSIVSSLCWLLTCSPASSKSCTKSWLHPKPPTRSWLHPKPCTRSWSWVHALFSSFCSILAIPSQLCLNSHHV